MTSPTPSPAKSKTSSPFKSGSSYPPIFTNDRGDNEDDDANVDQEEEDYNGRTQGAGDGFLDRMVRELTNLAGNIATSRPSFPSDWPQLSRSILPIFGTLSHHALAVAVFNPKLIKNLSNSLGVRGSTSTNVLLASATLGLSVRHFDLFRRDSLEYRRDRLTEDQQKLDLAEDVFHSVYGSLLDTLGSCVLLALVSRSPICPDNPMIKTIMALATSAIMIDARKRYFAKMFDR